MAHSLHPHILSLLFFGHKKCQSYKLILKLLVRVLQGSSPHGNNYLQLLVPWLPEHGNPSRNTKHPPFVAIEQSALVNIIWMLSMWTNMVCLFPHRLYNPLPQKQISQTTAPQKPCSTVAWTSISINSW
jgi:hypothetical protein